MSTILYPFKTVYLKTGQTREEIRDLVLEQTFLSDQGYRKTDDRKKFFFGEVSEQEFYLETLDNSNRLCPFIRGRILGVGKETYVMLSLREFRHQRGFIVLAMFVLACLVVFIRGLLLEGSEATSNMPFLVFGAVLVAVTIYALSFTIRFGRHAVQTVDFFRGLLQADLAKKNEVPGVFRL